MFARRIHITRSAEGGEPQPVPEAWLDSFAMRNFTNRAIFDDTLPTADGQLEAGYRVPLAELAAAMEHWFRRKGWLRPGDALSLVEHGSNPPPGAGPKGRGKPEPLPPAS